MEEPPKQESLTIELTTQEYTNLEVLARKRHTTPWLCILGAVLSKADNEDDDQNTEDWWKKV